MKTIDKLVLKVFLYGLPIAILMALGASFFNAETIGSQPGYLQALYNFSGLVFGLWMSFSLYLSGRLIFSKVFRETVLTKLTFFKEQDEREVLLSARATKTSFLTTLAILICLLCLSIFQVSIDRLPPDKAIDGKTGTISLGVSLSLSDPGKAEKEMVSGDSSQNYFVYSGVPVSKTAIILFLILWQIVSYNFTIRAVTRNT